MSLTFTDIFCGAGGSSIGLTGAGFELKLAANHWPRAIETHAANFADAEHLCADVNNYDMRRLPSTDVLWASPICTEISPAGGRGGGRDKKLSKGQLGLLEYGPVSKAGFERTRATFHDVIRATEVHRYSAVLVENVVEVAEKWELFDWWVNGMRQLGYQVQFVSASSAHIGGEGNPHAPQWRDRLYLVFTLNGIPLPDVAPRPPAWCEPCGKDIHAVQTWKNPDRRKVGKYRQQYVYRCPESACRHSIVEPYVLPAAAAIDWSDIGNRIGDRLKPLAAATMRRISAGIEMFGQPTVVAAGGNTWERPGSGYFRAWPALDSPMMSRTGTPGDGVACPPMLVPAGGTWNDTAASTENPMRTRTARDAEALCVPAPFITMLRNNNLATGIHDPLKPLTTGRNHYLTVPDGAFYMKNYGGQAEARHMVKSLNEPLGVITSQDHHSLVIPYRRGTAKPVTEPLHTLATRESAGLLRTAINIDDCYFRMLKPREHLRGQRFPDSYTVLGNQGEQTMQAGNAVSANVAQWLGGQLAKVLGGAA